MSERPVSGRSTRDRLCALLAHPRGHWVTVVFALLFTIPCIGHRLVLDDHVLALQTRDDPGIAGFRSRPLDLFTFTDGDPANNHKLIDEGALLPWWSHPELRVAFFRPLSSATHMFDFAFLSNHVPWMYVHSLLWWAALLFGLAHIYHRFHGHTAFAGFALLLYAIDDVHGATLSWISNRNAVIATVLALPALGTLHRARTQDWKPGYLIGPACFAIALCAGETAVGLCAYLLAYAVFIDRAPWRTRLAALAPYGVVVVIWRVAYQAFGYGAFGSDAYHDPGREPLAFIAAAAVHIPILLGAQFGSGAPPIADLYAVGPPQLALSLIITALVTLAVGAAIIWPVLRNDALSRFWLLGALISVLPVAASVPGERLLVFVGVGAAPVIAATIQHWVTRATQQRTLLTRVVAFGLLLTHLVIAPIGLLVRGGSTELLGSMLDHTDASLGHDAALAGDHVVVVNAPFDMMVSYLQVARQSRGRVRPKHFHWLATASSKLAIERTGHRTLRITPEHGFVRTITERHYNSEPKQLRVGHKIALSGLSITIIETGKDGRPAVVDFTFDRDFGAPGLRVLQWNGHALEPFVAPGLGRTIGLPEGGFVPNVVRHALTMTP